MYFLLVQTVFASAKLTIKNNCDFEIKPLFQGGDSMPAIAAGQSSTPLTAPIRGSRMYFGPADYIDGGGNKEHLGFLEFNAGGQSINLNPSMIDYVGLPMKFEQLSGGNVVKSSGCTSSNYQGLESFQSHIKNYCPGNVKKLDSSTELYYCTSTDNFQPITGTKIESDWNIDATISSSELFKQTSCSASDLGQGNKARLNVGNCQPVHCIFNGSTPHQACAEMNRGSSDSHNPSSFYSKPSPYDPTKDTQWEFNPYAAFVHLICGPTIFAFPTDDTGAHGGYIAAGPNDEAVITICPAAGTGANSPGVLPPVASSANGKSNGTSSTTASATSSSADATTKSNASSESNSSTSSTTTSPSESDSESPSSASSTTISPTSSGSASSSSTSGTTASPSESDSEPPSSSSTTISPTSSGSDPRTTDTSSDSRGKSSSSTTDSTAALHI